MKTKSRQMNMDFLRITACIMVVLLHVASQNWHMEDVNSFSWKIFNFYDVLVRSAVPLFIMISGMLFLSRPSMKPIKGILRENVFKLVVVYFIWALFYAIDSVGLHSLISQFSMSQLFEYIVHSKYHLWYLPALISIYFAIPILWVIVKYEDGKYLHYVCLMFFIFGICQTTLNDIQGISTSTLNMIFHRFTYVLSGYSGYFLLGYLLNKEKDKFKSIKSKYLVLLFIVIIILATKLNELYAIHLNQPTTLLYDTMTLLVFLEASIIFLLFLRIPHVNFSKIVSTAIIRISRYTLFVYLFHVFVLEHLNLMFDIHTLSFNPIFSVPILTVFIFVICLVFAYIIDHIPILNKWIM